MVEYVVHRYTTSAIKPLTAVLLDEIGVTIHVIQKIVSQLIMGSLLFAQLLSCSTSWCP